MQKIVSQSRAEKRQDKGKKRDVMESFDRNATHLNNLFWVVIDVCRSEDSTVTMSRDEATRYYGRLSLLVWDER